MKLLYSLFLMVFIGNGIAFSQTSQDSIVPMDTTVFYADSLHFYDFISPNGDGHNDNFVVEYIQYFPNSSLMVFNVWGQLVYKNNNYKNEFDGHSNSSMLLMGKELPEGVYYYTLIDTLKKKHTGKITIKR